MKQYIAGSAVFLLCIIFFGGLFIVKEHEYKTNIASIIEKEKQDSTSYYRDQYTTEHAITKQIEANLNIVRATNMAELDSARQRLGIKDKQIQSLNKMLATSTGTFTTILIHDTIPFTVPIHGTNRHDTITASDKVFRWQDSTLNEVGIIKKDSSIQVSYGISVPIDFDFYWQRPHKFIGIKYGKPIHFIDAYSTNPNVHIKGLQSIYIKPKETSRLKWAAIGALSWILLSHFAK